RATPSGRRLARTCHTLAGAGSVLAAPQGPPRSQWGSFSHLANTICIGKALKAPLIPWGTAMPFAIIPRQCEKSGPAPHVIDSARVARSTGGGHERCLAG